MGRSRPPVRDVIDRLLAEGSATARSDGSFHELFPVAISEAEGESLRAWVIRERALHTIEVGLGYGVSTLFICEALISNGVSAARHVAVDPHQSTRFAACGLQFLEEAGVADLVEHHAVESQVFLPQLLAEGESFDLAFVDGDHRFDGVFVDLVYLGRLLRPGSIVFLDDLQLPSVAKAAAFFTSNRDWKVEEVSTEDTEHHWAVLTTSTSVDHRRFDDFADF